jgi:hypothetical protein
VQEWAANPLFKCRFTIRVGHPWNHGLGLLTYNARLHYNVFLVRLVE